MSPGKRRFLYRAKTPDGWRWFPADFIKFKVYPGGMFALRRYVGGRKVYESVGRDPNEAHRLWATALEEEEQAAKDRARSGNGSGGNRKVSLHLLKKAITAYVSDCKGRKAMEAARDATHVLAEFQRVTGLIYTKDVNQDAILKYQAWLRANGRGKHQARNTGATGGGVGSSDRTVKNKTLRVLAFMRFAGIDVKQTFDSRTYMPRVERRRPRTYDSTQVEQLMSAVSDIENGSLPMAVLFGLKLGLRDLEIAHAAWTGVDWEASVYTVRSMPAFGWVIKDKEEREVPIPPDLLIELSAWRNSHPSSKLIVGTKRDRPNFHLLRSLKRAIRRAGLNCRICAGCAGKARECTQWDLHTLRRTYITSMLRAGYDVATIQAWVGHSDLASTMAYLRPAAAKDAQLRLSTVQWGA